MYGHAAEEGGSGVDLKWLPALESAHLAVSLVKQAQEDRQIRVVKIADMFLSAGLDVEKEIEVKDQDVDVSISLFAHLVHHIIVAFD